ncbi:MAG: iron chaperone [Bacteroidota bacterium]|jgi:uncharacterized protein YdhG (YjbR/CyaY superfamily)
MKFHSVDEYIASFPASTRKQLLHLKKIILEACPNAEELISYNMPAYKQKKVLVYFAAYQNHIGFYPTSSGVKHFLNELKPYKTSKGAIQFPLHQTLPKDLIQRIVEFRMEEE